MVIDFGKASYIESKETYPSLTESQIKIYKDCHRHIAPELYLVRAVKSVHSDIYSVGWMLRNLEQCFLGFNVKPVFEKCLHSCPSLRPNSMLIVDSMLSELRQS